MLDWNKTEMKKLKAAQAEVAEVERQLNQAFPERRPAIRSMLVARHIGEHVLLLGPPGTGKSLMTSVFADAVAGGSYFEILMTKFAVPEEIFGPVSYSALKQDRYERAMAGYAPDKRVWFLDEIWKASSAILNALLKATNERVVVNGGKLVSIPLETVIGASNEYPQDDSLQAMYDRFAFRHWIDYIADDDNLAKLWAQGGRPSKVDAKLSKDAVAVLKKAICEMRLDATHLDTFRTIKAAVVQEGFLPSTRTWMKALKIVKAMAVLSGRTAVAGSDFAVLANVLWKQHEDRPKLQQVIGNAADPYGSRAEAIVDGVKAAMAGLPSLDSLKAGQITKAEITKAIAEVSGQVSGERDKLAEVAKEAGGSDAVDEATETVEAALSQVDKLMQEVLWYRGGK